MATTMAETVLGGALKKKAKPKTGVGITVESKQTARPTGIGDMMLKTAASAPVGQTNAQKNEEILNSLGLDTVLQPKRKKKVSDLTDTLGG